jgi:hypothetical protein
MNMKTIRTPNPISKMRATMAWFSSRSLIIGSDLNTLIVGVNLSLCRLVVGIGTSRLIYMGILIDVALMYVPNKQVKYFF